MSAVAGADATSYTLPSKEEATKTSSIVLRNGCRHADQATIGVSISYSKGTKSFSYSCGNQLQAGYKLNIKGAYTSKAGVTLTGTMTGATWLGERNIEFSFDDDGTINVNGRTNSTDTDNFSLVDHIPSRGETHVGCCIFAVTEQTENSATLKLLSSKEISGIIDSGYTADKLQSAIQTNITQCSMPGIDGWRLPTEDEITTISNNNGYINRMLKEANITPITSGSYFRQMNNGNIGAYNITSIIHTGYIDKSTYLRPVATLKVRLR